MIRVVVTGSECTGKTTLARALAEHYDTIWVPEYARQFVHQQGAPPEYRHVEAIARGQIRAEKAAASTNRDLIIQDTDLLSTMIYSRHYYGDCPSWIEDSLLQRIPDLYLLAAIDVPWVPDGDQRDRGDRREEMQTLFRHALENRQLEFVEIRGSHDERLAAAIASIDPLFPA